ncbi:MAG: hypothetical protein HUU20_11525 [Pirellulales bacterium]|nr:hypothetical protein [Pirellulales bacterium]
MKWLPITVFVLFVLAAIPATAEKPTAPSPVFAGTISPGEMTPTPEMWFYEQQMRMYQDPLMAVRQKAETRATQRQHRVASRKWFGFSNLRPTAGSDPIHGDYSPHWASNNTYHPSRWNGYGPATIVVTPRTRTY